MPTAFMSMLPRPCATGLLRPKRLFEVDGTTGGAPSSHCGLEARGGHGLPPATAPSIMPESAGRELQAGTAGGGGGGGGGAPFFHWSGSTSATDGPDRGAHASPPPPRFAWSPSLGSRGLGSGRLPPRPHLGGVVLHQDLGHVP